MASEPSHPYTVLDVFTGSPLAGNALAVFTEGQEIPSRLMQAAARELNLSETIFLLPGDHQADATVRIFTPGAELPFAGHPVIGAAFVVGGATGLDTVRLRTGMGVVPVTLTREHGEIVHGEMEQPLPTITPFPDTTALLRALALDGVDSAALPVEIYSNGPKQVMVALSSPEQVAALAPDMGALIRAGIDIDLPRLGVNCFAKVSDGHFKTRNFSPALGVPEDPATGSAAGPLALHLVRHGWIAPGEEIEIAQGVEIHRPSLLRARIDGDPANPTKIAVGGSAVTVAHGHFRLA